MRELTKEELKLVVGGADGKNEVYASGTSSFSQGQGRSNTVGVGYLRHPTKNSSIGFSVNRNKDSGQKAKRDIVVGGRIDF